MAHTPKAFAAACALTVSLALTPVLDGRSRRPGRARAPAGDDHPPTRRPQRPRPRSKPRNGYGLRLTTFNILSSSIARGGIDRATRAARWVQDQGADAAAFQEVAKDQLRQMQTVMPSYNFFPRRGLGTRGSAIQIAWNSKTVKQMDTGYIMRPVPRLVATDSLRPPARPRDRPWLLGRRDPQRPRRAGARARHLHRRRDQADQEAAGRPRPPGVRDRRRQRAFRVLPQGRRCDPAGLDERRHGRRSRAPSPASVARTGCSAPARSSPDFEKVYNGISDHPALTARAWVPVEELTPPHARDKARPSSARAGLVVRRLW